MIGTQVTPHGLWAVGIPAVLCIVRISGDWMPTNKFYGTSKYKAWREKVMKRDKYLCQECARYGRRTEATVAHHIKHLDEYPELRYSVANGMALCAACHSKAHPEKGGNHRDSA